MGHFAPTLPDQKLAGLPPEAGPGFALVILAGAAFGACLWLFRSASIPLQNMTITRASESGDYWPVALSPDGNYMATVRQASQGHDSLWMSHLPTRSNTQIVPAESSFEDATFSPDVRLDEEHPAQPQWRREPR